MTYRRGAYVLFAGETTRGRAVARALSGRALPLDPTEVALAQYVDGTCHRYDLVIRLLALEEWAGRPEGGVALYERFVARKSAAQGWSRPSHSAGAFRALALEVERSGFARVAPVVVSPGRVLRDGMHRLACAVFFDLAAVPAVVDPGGFERPDYGVPALRALGFPDAEIRAVVAAESRYRERWLARVRG